MATFTPSQRTFPNDTFTLEGVGETLIADFTRPQLTPPVFFRGRQMRKSWPWQQGGPRSPVLVSC